MTYQVARFAHAVAALCVLSGGCAADAPSAEQARNGLGTDAAVGGRGTDAGPVDDVGVPDAGTPTSLDAGMQDAGAEPASDAGSVCETGKMMCDGDCIDEIAPIASALHGKLFLRSCALSSSCHAGSSPKEGLKLESLDDVFSTAVDQDSAQMPGRSAAT
jgi:hypothetical protein